MEQKRNNPKSMWMFITSSVIFGTIGIFRKYIPLPSPLLACWRGSVGACFLFLYSKIMRKGMTHRIPVKKVLYLALVGAVMGLNWIFLFEAYNYTTVATATLCYYMEPTIVMLLSPVFFKERLTGKKWLCVVCSVIGMVFISGIVETGIPDLSQTKGIIYGLIAACLYSAMVIMNKRLPGMDAYEKTIIQLAAAALVLIPYIFATGGVDFTGLSIKAVLALLIVGFVHTGIAYALYFGSMEGLRGQSIAIFSYIDPVVALVLSVLLLKEKMTILGIVGAVFILASAIYGEMGE